MTNQTIIFAVLLTQLFPVFDAFSQRSDIIGVTALREIAPGINGGGVRVGQAEAYTTVTTNDFEVNPAAVGLPVSLFTYHSGNSTSATYPNSLGVESGHANAVAGTFYGPSGVATNVAHVDEYDANFLLNGAFVFVGLNPADKVLNSSFIFGNVPADITVAEQQAIDSAYDNFSATNRTLFVSGVGNGGSGSSVAPAGTCYNGIGVGVIDGGSSFGPTVDNGRCKPDLVAFGVFTSFSTPAVAGAATLLTQAALRGDGGSDTNAASDLRVLKALLLNGAVKPLAWTNGNSTPLDARFGAGVVNVFNSYQQLVGGKNLPISTNKAALNAVHPPDGATGTVTSLSGWNYATNTSSATNDTIHHYFFNVSNAVASVKFSATATLVWHRHVNKTNINNLNLFLYNCANSNLVLASTSVVDNVEHLYITNLAQGRYDLQVWKAGGTVVTTNEGYALAWQFTPPPVLSISNAALVWPLYPAGYLVETRTNLLTGTWRTNGIPAPIITNGMNTLPLNMTNAAQFFRLRTPSF